MTFARQIPKPAFDFSQFIDTDFAKDDPCLNCTLWKCDETSKECRYIQITDRRPEPEPESEAQIKRDLIAILEKLRADLI